MDAATTENNNTVLGYNAAGAIRHDDADNNVIIGYNAGRGGTAATTDCIIIGSNAGESGNIGGADNVFIGKSAGAGTWDTGSMEQNVAIGTLAMGTGTKNSADYNVAIGYKALENITTADTNVAIGFQAGQLSTIGGNNVFVGANAGETNVEGQKNVAIGTLAFYNGQEDSGCVAVGYEALNDADVSNTGSAVLSYNTAVGYQCGDSITTGKNNTGLGASCAFDVDANNQTCIGYQATTSAANAVKIGNGSVSAANIQVDWTIDSDIRIKKDVIDNTLGLSFINSLKTRKYRKLHPADWDKEIREKRYEKDERDEFDDVKVWDGLIAQEVKEAVDKSGTTFSGWSEDSNGKQGIQYSAMVMPLIKAVQELSLEVNNLKQQLKEQS